MRLFLIVVAAILPLAVLAQDAPDIADLVRKLGHEDFHVRAGAERALLKIGAPALAELNRAAKSDDLEVRTSVQKLLAEINRCPVPAPLTLNRKASAREMLASLPDVGGIDTTLVDAELDALVSIAVSKGTSFDVLDSICRQIKTIRYQIKAGRVRFVDEPFVERMAFHDGALRVKLDSIERDSDEDPNRKGKVWLLNFRGDALPMGRAIGNPAVTLTEVLDDQGNKVELTEYCSTLIKSERPISNLRSVKGFVTFYFRTDWREIIFDYASGTGGKPQEVGDLKVSLIGYRGGFDMWMHVESADPGKPIPQGVVHELVDRESAIIVDKRDGKEVRMPVSFVGSGGGEVVYIDGVRWSRADGAIYNLDPGNPPLHAGFIKQIRVRVSSVAEKKVPFEFKDLKLD